MRRHVHVQANAGVKPDGIARRPTAPAQTQAHTPPAGAIDFDFTSLPAQAPIRIQPKLTIGQTDDPLEREADRAADDAMRMPDGASPIKAPAASHDPTAHGVPAPAAVHSVLASSGQPLDAGVRTFFEPRFGHDFSNVRVHSDSAASDSARQAHALAYTAGSHVVFRADRYQPHTAAGRQLIGHELAHVAQQTAGGTAGVVRRQTENSDESLLGDDDPFKLRRKKPSLSEKLFPINPSSPLLAPTPQLDFSPSSIHQNTLPDDFLRNRETQQPVNPDATKGYVPPKKKSYFFEHFGGGQLDDIPDTYDEMMKDFTPKKSEGITKLKALLPPGKLSGVPKGGGIGADLQIQDIQTFIRKLRKKKTPEERLDEAKRNTLLP